MTTIKDRFDEMSSQLSRPEYVTKALGEMAEAHTGIVQPWHKDDKFSMPTVILGREGEHVFFDHSNDAEFVISAANHFPLILEYINQLEKRVIALESIKEKAKVGLAKVIDDYTFLKQLL